MNIALLLAFGFFIIGIISLAYAPKFIGNFSLFFDKQYREHPSEFNALLKYTIGNPAIGIWIFRVGGFILSSVSIYWFIKTLLR